GFPLEPSETGQPVLAPASSRRSSWRPHTPILRHPTRRPQTQKPEPRGLQAEPPPSWPADCGLMLSRICVSRITISSNDHSIVLVKTGCLPLVCRLGCSSSRDWKFLRSSILMAISMPPSREHHCGGNAGKGKNCRSQAPVIRRTWAYLATKRERFSH